MTNLAARCARWSSTHWKLAVGGWLALVLSLFWLGGAVGSRQLTGAESSSGEAAAAERILAGAGFDDQAGESVLAQSASVRVTDQAFRAVLASVRDRLTSLDNVERVQSPLDPGGQGLIARDGHAALVRFEIDGDPDDASGKVAPILAEVAAIRARHPGWTIEQFGPASVSYQLDATVGEDFERAERLSVPMTLLVLLVAFGALAAASVPVVLAFSAVIGTLGLAALVSHVVPTTETTASVILLVGMAVGVDYSLFYLRREREETAAGLPPRSALQRAAATSGQAVLISGATVVIAMAGMLLAGNAAFTSLGVGTILVVTMAVAGSLTVLPALLARLGHRVEWGRIRMPGGRRSRRGAGRRGRAGESRLWSAVLTRVLARPALAASAATIGLIALALPALGMRTQLSGIADLPRDLPVARAYERFQAAFPGSWTPATVVVKAADVTAPPVRAAVAELRRQAVASGEMAEPVEVKVNQDRTVAAVSVPLAGNGSDARSVHALETLRERVVPGTVGRLDGTTVAVTGETAGTTDFNHLMRQRAPLVFAFVLGLAFLLLLVTFRSLVVPAKAIVLNLLSVAASYGVLVAVFQRGWGASLLGVEPGGAIVAWLPLFLFVILFGLSMDYHVFILSRVRELVDAGVPTNEAVGRAIRLTAGTVTSAAAVMVAVFAIFASLRTVDVKQAGVGLAVAVLLDATVVRAVLLPAAMALLGEWNWYLPRWLGWLPGAASARQLPRPIAEPVEPVPEPAGR
jgi:RND superfamily putative drug exporter